MTIVETAGLGLAYVVGTLLALAIMILTRNVGKDEGDE